MLCVHTTIGYISTIHMPCPDHKSKLSYCNNCSLLYSQWMLERNSDIIQMEIHCLAQLLNECCQRPYWHYHNKAGEVLPSNVDIVQGAYFKNGSLSFINYKSFQRMLKLIPEGLTVMSKPVFLVIP